MRAIGAPAEMIEAVARLVENHMEHLNSHTSASVRRLAMRMMPSTISHLMRVIEADQAARPPLSAELSARTIALYRLAVTARIINGPVVPILLGRHLIERGMKPGPAMGPILRAAFEAQLDGLFGTIEGALGWLDAYMAA